MDDPLVSICCLTFNHEPYIRQCIEGFLLQKTAFPIEILIHDDASIDNTAEIIREYEARFPGIVKPIYQIENQYSKGVGVSRVFQFPRAKGKYIAMCEGDDYWIDPLKLQKQVDFLEKHHEYGIVHSGYMKYIQNKDQFEKVTVDFSKFNFVENRSKTFSQILKGKYHFCTATICFRSNFIKESINLIDRKNFSIGDLPLILLITSVSKVYFLQDITTVYRVLPKSLSHPSTIESMRTYILSTRDIRFYFLNTYSRIIEDIKEVENCINSSFLRKAFSLNDKDLFFDHCKTPPKGILNFFLHFFLKNNLIYLIKPFHRILCKRWTGGITSQTKSI